MKSSKPARSKLSRIALLPLVVAAAAWFLGCGDDLPTGLGSKLRTPPDSLRLLDFTTIVVDSSFPVPVSLGRATTVQIGSEFPYQAHVLYDFSIPTRVVSGSDTLRLDTASFIVRSDSFQAAPFQGAMRIRVAEVDTSARSWADAAHIDSAIVHLPLLEPGLVARDTVLSGSALADHSARLQFDLVLSRITGYDSVRAAGGTLDVNLALVFQGFEPSGKGFLNLSQPAQEKLVGFSNNQVEAIATSLSNRRRSVVEFDSTYSPGTKLVVSDGFRLHSFVQFDDIRKALPESALVFRADLLLTQVDSLDGTSFGSGASEVGVIIPDTTGFTTKSSNGRLIAFKSTITPVTAPNTVTIAVTPYLFDQQEGNVKNRGMILGLTNEGTLIRHFEFYGAAAPDTLRRPRLRIVYGFPAPFEGGHR